MRGDGTALFPARYIRVVDDEGHIILFPEGRRTLAGHSMCATEFTMIGGKDDDGILEHAQILEIGEKDIQRPVVVADTVEIIILHPLPALILVGNNTGQQAHRLLIIMVCPWPSRHVPGLPAAG